MNEDPFDFPPPVDAPGRVPPDVAGVARLFPDFKILGIIGCGDFGATYQARQCSLERLVAIKLLPLEVSRDPEFAERFRKEARALAKLHHPHIIAVHDFGATREGHLFLVMDFIAGVALRDIIYRPAEVVAGVTDSSCNLDPEQALAIVAQVCTTLAYAHSMGVVHRGLEPDKVLIDAEGQVKISDFGLSSRPGSSPGMSGYVAPEQVNGGSGDRRTDIFRLGVMLYEMLCREVPTEAFVPPSARIGCDPQIDTIILRAIQHVPERRYQSAQEMRTAVAAALNAPSPPPRWVAPASVAAPEKSRLPLYTALVVVLAALVFAVTHFAKPTGKSNIADGTIPRETTSRGADATTESSVLNGAREFRDHLVTETAGSTMGTREDETLATNDTPPSADPPASQQPKSGVEKWLADMDGPQQAAFQKRVVEPFAAGLEELRRSYLAALDAGQAKAAAAGKLDQVLIWNEERRAFEDDGFVRSDNDTTSAAIRPLRAAFRLKIAQIEKERARRAKPLHASYDAILIKNQTLLTQRDRIDDAMLLKNKREEIAKAWLGTPIATPPPDERTAANLSPAPEGLTLLAESSARDPVDNFLALRVGTLQAWFGRNADHAETCQRMIASVERSESDPFAAERAAKVWCLLPSREPGMADRVLALARRAARIATDDEQYPWFQQTLGMVEFRAGNDEASEAAFKRAEEAAETDNWRPKSRPFVQGPARLYRAMILFRNGKKGEAERLFRAAEAQLKPLPADEARFWSDDLIQDPVLYWLTYREAKALLQIPD